MISTGMKSYDYFTFGSDDKYGQPQLSEQPTGKIRMFINIISQSPNENILYTDASYIGLTFGYVDDTYVIQHGNEKLKVLYVNSKGRYNQVFMKNYD